jgi:hypothetical protein
MYRIHVTNGDFRVNNDRNLPNSRAALKEGTKGALQIGSDEVTGGKSFFGAEITVALDGEILERRMVAVGATPLQ